MAHVALSPSTRVQTDICSYFSLNHTNKIRIFREKEGEKIDQILNQIHLSRFYTRVLVWFISSVSWISSFAVTFLRKGGLVPFHCFEGNWRSAYPTQPVATKAVVKRREMLLRSSSTPVLGSLLPCYSESPNNNLSDVTIKHSPTTIYQAHNKLSLYQAGSLNLSSVSCNSSPISPSVNAGHRGFQRAQSDGNLKGLAYASCNDNNEFSIPNLPKKSLQRPSCSMLQTIPSFSFYGLRCWNEDEESDEEEEEEEEEWEEVEENDGERFVAMGDEEFSFENIKKMGLIRENGGRNVAFEKEKELVDSEMHLARGLGVSGVDFAGGDGGGGGDGSGGDFTPGGSSGESGDRPGVEEYYKRMLEENPSNPLFLRNYAQFLYQSKHDLQGAEEYLGRAILADPKDGEILSQYAKLVWELHHDQDRASSYFELAVEAAPEDCHVQAAYASFLWETEDDDDDRTCHVGTNTMPPFLHGEAMASGVS